MVTRTNDVIAIGNAIVDIIRRCDDSTLQYLGGHKGHMSLVKDSGSIAQVYTHLDPAIEVAGGCASNVAVGIASLGGQAEFIGKIADDKFGRIFQHDIRSVGVMFSTAPTVVRGKETSHCLVMVTPDGQRTMYTFLGCSTELENALIDPEAIKNSKIVFLEGYLFDKPEAKTAFWRALSVAKAGGRMVALSLSDSFCVKRHRSEFLKLIRSGIDILFANESEIVTLYETRSFESAVRNAGRDVKLAALTRGDKGSVIVSDCHPVLIHAEKVLRVVDATGAGDLYAAGVLYGLTHNIDLNAAARLGSFAAAEIIGSVGARPEVRLEGLARMRGLIA